MPFRFKTVKVNLVEDSRWKWDQATDWASDNAFDDFNQLSNNDCTELVDDLVTAAFPRTFELTEEDQERICEAIQEAGTLESTHNVIVDAMTYAWEVAYTPTDSDGEHALERAKEGNDIQLRDHWSRLIGTLREGRKEWQPVKPWTEKTIVDALLKEVEYQQKKGWYDRYLVFSFGKAKPVQALLAATPENFLQDTRARLEEDFDEWQDNILRAFYRELEDVMQDADTHMRVDFREQWDRMLADRQTMDAVRNELAKFLRGGRKDWKPPKE